MEKEINFYELLDEKIISDDILKDINKYNFKYNDITEEEYNKVILKILKKLDSGTFDKSGNINKWEKGWSENLIEFKNSGNIDLLIPKYIHKDDECRLGGKYIKAIDENIEMNVLAILIKWMLSTYLSNCSDIFEFGCGSGHNLITGSRLYPNINFHGSDWTQASVDIINLIREIYHFNIDGCKFDIFNPDFNLEIPENSGIFTIGCLEQSYDNFYDFVDFLLAKKPKIVCHFEPILEFYDRNNLLDYLSIKFHLQRNYLNGYYTYLSKLERENKIRILKSHRVKFGSLFQDSWSIIIWEVI